MSVTIHDWNNNTNQFKNLKQHNGRYLTINGFYDIDWSKYYIYPQSLGNVRTSAFEFYPYEDSSSGPVPMSVIVDNYDNKNAITYPLEFNLSLNRYPNGWGIQQWNNDVKLTALKYNRSTSEGNYDFCPALLEPGTVVYGGTLSSDICKVLTFTGEDVTIERSSDFQLKINNIIYSRLHFKDHAIPKRLYITVQAAGGGGGGAQYIFLGDGMSACGGASGAYACMILDLTAGDRIWRITGGKGGAGGANTGSGGKHDGTNGDDTYISLQVNGQWKDIATLYGGEGGLRGDHGLTQRNSIPGKIKLYNEDKKWYWCFEHSPENTDTNSPGYGGKEGGTGSGISTGEMLLADNSNNMSGSKVKWPATRGGGKSGSDGGYGGGSLVYWGGGGTREGTGGYGGQSYGSGAEDGVKGGNSLVLIYLIYED